MLINHFSNTRRQRDDWEKEEKNTGLAQSLAINRRSLFQPSTLTPKSDEPTVLIPIEEQIQQRAYELYEQRGRTDGHDLDDWLQAECEIKGTQANAAAA